MITVFIAMPYGDDNSAEVRKLNTDKAMAVWHTLADAGFLPFCPHLSHFLHEYRARPRKEWLMHAMLWLEKCDCVLTFGNSEGVSGEVRRAHLLGKPVFTMYGDLASAYGMEIPS